jgi:hypothetical protein
MFIRQTDRQTQTTVAVNVYELESSEESAFCLAHSHIFYAGYRVTQLLRHSDARMFYQMYSI